MFIGLRRLKFVTLIVIFKVTLAFELPKFCFHFQKIYHFKNFTFQLEQHLHVSDWFEKCLKKYQLKMAGFEQTQAT